MTLHHLQDLVEQTSSDLDSRRAGQGSTVNRAYARGVQDALKALEKDEESADTYSRAYGRTVTAERVLTELRTMEPHLADRNHRGAISSRLDNIILMAEGLRGMLSAWWTAPDD